MERFWRILVFSLVSGLFLFLPAKGVAVETAPRISDREIIESLAELKAGQKALQQQIEDFKQSTQQQINDLKNSTQQQINDLKNSTQQQVGDLRQDTQRQINDLRQEMNVRFDDMNRRFDDMNRRFNDVIILLQILIGALVVVLGGTLAWLVAIWRRLVRVEERQKAFETQDDEIKFLKESIGRSHEMLMQLMTRLPQ